MLRASEGLENFKMSLLQNVKRQIFKHPKKYR
jgi:hypothetical protein